MRPHYRQRRDLIVLLGGAAVAWPLSARGQKPDKNYHVAYLTLVGDRDAMIVKQRLGELGYIEGRNLTFDFQSAQGHPERLPKLAAALVTANPDVIVAGFGTATAKAAQRATTTIPVVFTAVGDPIGSGIVKSLSRPGENVTGIHAQATDMSSKRLQLLTELAPGIRTVAVVVNQEAPFTAVALPELKIAADARGLKLELCDAGSVERLASCLETVARAGATGLTILETPLLLNLRRPIVDLAASLRLRAVYTNREFVAAGGLASYGPDRLHLYRRAADLVDKILKGQKPADIPVEQPTKFEFIINLKTARTLGLALTPMLLARADEVIE